jgi:predicted DNA-binding transcriptional regulator AlpA
MQLQSSSSTGKQIAGRSGTAAETVPPGKRLVGVAVLAAKYGCDERTVYRWADAGLIPWGRKIGGLRKWDLDEIDAHIESGCKPVRTTKGGAL